MFIDFSLNYVMAYKVNKFANDDQVVAMMEKTITLGVPVTSKFTRNKQVDYIPSRKRKRQKDAWFD